MAIGGSARASDTLSLALKSAKPLFSSAAEIELILVLKNTGDAPVSMLNPLDFSCGHLYQLMMNGHYATRTDAVMDCYKIDHYEILKPGAVLEFALRPHQAWTLGTLEGPVKLALEYHAFARPAEQNGAVQTYWVGTLNSNEIDVVIQP